MKGWRGKLKAKVEETWRRELGEGVRQKAFNIIGYILVITLFVFLVQSDHPRAVRMLYVNVAALMLCIVMLLKEIAVLIQLLVPGRRGE